MRSLSRLLDALPLGIWHWSASDRTVSLSASAAALYGLEREASLERDQRLTLDLEAWLKLVDPEDEARVRGALQRLELGKSQSFEHRLAKHCLPEPGAAPVWLRHEATVTARGHVIEVSGVCWDVTRDKAREQELEKRCEELEAQVQARGDLIAMIAHDLSTPLSNILLRSDLLLDAERPASEWRRYLEVIKRSGQRIERIAHELHDYTRAVSGELGLELGEYSIVELCEEELAKFSPLLDGRELSFLPCLDRSLKVQCDKERIVQVISNLLANALKFTPNDARIVVAVRTVGAEVEVSVADNGRGIVPESLPYVFRKYFSARRERSGGLGLGLFISKALVSAHGGRIWFDSKPGVGTTFCFTLPLTPSIAPQREEATERGTPDLRATERAGKILDDSGEVRADLLRPHIVRSWQRAVLAGCDPEQRWTTQRQRAASKTPEPGPQATHEQWPLIRAARPYLLSLTRALHETTHAVCLADEKGLVLEVVGQPDSVFGDRVVFGPGTSFDVAVAGANGIGTALLEESYVEVVGPEHYIRSFRDFTCQATVIRNIEGEIIGAISATFAGQRAIARLRDILTCGAGGIEAELLSNRLLEDVERARHRVHEHESLERVRQDLLQLHAAARLALEMATEPSYSEANAPALLARADRLSRRFGEQARLWRELASSNESAAQSVSLSRLVDDVCDLLKTEARTRGIDLIVAAEPVEVRAERGQVARSLLSTILNGFDAAGTNGGVCVRVLPNNGKAKVLVEATAGGSMQSSVFSFEPSLC